MALNGYLQQTQRLLNDEANQFFNLADLTVYVNLARNDIARQTECLIAFATLTTIVGNQSYSVASGLAAPTGLLAPLNLRSLASVSAGAVNRLEARSWQWFSNYYLNGSNSLSVGPLPTVWGQQKQGSMGIIFIWPTPNVSATVTVEATWTPIPLANDSTVEALPYPWTDVVPYFAAYAALLQAQRMSDASNIFKLYNTFVQSAKLGVTPQWMPGNFPTLKPLPGAIDPSLSMAGPAGKPAQQGEGSL